MIPKQFHRRIIGSHGESINRIREMFNNVLVAFPEPHRLSERVTLTGAECDIIRCYKYLQQLTQELVCDFLES